jgi:hypothetical protein
MPDEEPLTFAEAVLDIKLVRLMLDRARDHLKPHDLASLRARIELAAEALDRAAATLRSRLL